MESWEGKKYLVEETTTYERVPLKDVYHFIHGHNETHTECYLARNFQIVNIDRSPIVEYLRGNTVYYQSQSRLFNVREESILYLLEEWHTRKFDVHKAIPAVYRDGRYIIHDGMHRTGVMYYMGVQQVTLHMVINWWEALDFTGKYVE